MNTIEDLKARYLARLEALSTRHGAAAAADAAAGRGDDAKLEKIRGNIVDIFITLVNATSGASYEGYCNAYLARFDTIPAAWRQRLQQAQTHGDGTTAAIEMVKLETAEKLRAIFRQEMEG